MEFFLFLLLVPCSTPHPHPPAPTTLTPPDHHLVLASKVGKKNQQGYPANLTLSPPEGAGGPRLTPYKVKSTKPLVESCALAPLCH